MDKPSFDLCLVKRFFDAETCRDLISEMRRSPDKPALTYGQSESGSIDETVRRVARITPSSKTVAYVTRRLMEHRKKIVEHFGINLTNCEEPQFLRYEVGDFFVAHQDGNTGLIQLETDRTRRVSVSIFLNSQSGVTAPETYCGGARIFRLADRRAA